MGHEIGRRGGVSAILAALSLGLLSTVARADGAFVIHLAAPKPGLDDDGDDDGTQNAGPGVEQPTVTALTKDGATYVVTIWMSSSVKKELGPWQCKCSSVKIADGGPEIVADQVLLTNNQNTNRPCNHPFAISDGAATVVWAWGYAENNDAQTQTYVQALDESCNALGSPKRISQDGNNNQGAPELAWAGAGRITAGYYDNNDQRTYYRSLALEGGQIETLGDSKVVVDPSDVGRPAIADSEGSSLICAAKGENRPPEDGVACALVDAATGNVLWDNVEIAESQPGKGIYFNQPSVAVLGPGRFALQVVESTGAGKQTNQKGGSRAHLYVLEPTAAGPGVQAHFDAGLIGAYQTHSAIVAGGYGTSGVRSVGLFEAPITGNGVPLLTVIEYDPASTSFLVPDLATRQWVVGPGLADSGYLANIYGQNPNDRGRDFMRGVGDVPNPGAGKSGAFMPHVKSFFALPYAGRASGDRKNGLYLSFVPGHTSEVVEPGKPEVVDTPAPGPQSSGEADPQPGIPGREGTGMLVPGTSSGCGCSTERRAGGGAAASALLVLALLSARRRSRSAAPR